MFLESHKKIILNLANVSRKEYSTKHLTEIVKKCFPEYRETKNLEQKITVLIYCQ